MEHPYTQLQFDVEMLKTRLDNMIRPATVTYVYRKKDEEGIKDEDDGKHIGFVDVVSGEIELNRIPVYTQHNEDDTVLWLPTEGEDGTIYSAGGDLANAFFVSAIPTKKQPIPTPTSPATQTILKEFRGGNREELVLKNPSGDEVNQYTHEIGERDEAFHKTVLGDSIVTFDKDKILIEHENSMITIQNDMIRQEMSPTIYKELTSKLANIIGAHFFPTGLTNIISPVGNCFFSPTPSPSSAPTPPAGSNTDPNGNVTRTPPERIDGVDVRSGSELDAVITLQNFSLVITTPIPVVTPAGRGTIAEGTYPVQLTGSPEMNVTGDLNITLPGRDL